MLKITTYTREDLVEIFNTERLDSIKRSLDRLGYRYSTSGRGAGLRLTITATPDAFKMFCINELGIPAQSDFELLKTFFYYFFCDEEFQSLPETEMERILAKEGKPVSRPTINKWIKFFKEKNYICADTTEYKYFAIVGSEGDKGAVEITKEEYLEAWHKYWGVINAGGNYFKAMAAMYKVHGGAVCKKAVITENGFYTEKINDLIDILSESL